MENKMTTPQWFSAPNEVLSEQDILEALEYEYAQYQIAKKEYGVSTGEDKYRLELDLLHSEMRIEQLGQQL